MKADILTSRQNPKITLLRNLMKSKKSRLEAGIFAAEGEKLFYEATASGLKPDNILITENIYKNNSKFYEYAANLCNINIISEEIAEYISNTKSPQGIFFTLKLLDKSENIDTIGNSVIVLDGLQDPGNAGTIIRSADAFGIDGLVLTENCVDINSPKVIRSAMGSAFRLPIYKSKIEQLKDKGFILIGATLSKKAEKLCDFTFPEKHAVIIGNEGSGISTEILNLCDKEIYVPIKNAESLNAATAASIIMYEMQKHSKGE
jgi:TrmH family RNA methyltransferase